MPTSDSPKVIAFYLPQFHPTPDNDKWWGKGFTEWTNVGKAKPLFRGHYQPKVPADLGYYDLRLPEVREAQVQLAKEAGVYGFCYYHYWFGSGKRELELPFNEVLRLGKPDFPFMLCWANESWHSKFWNIDGTVQKNLLVEQLYPDVEDIVNHFYALLPAFKDKRYIHIDGKPAFMIYRPFDNEVIPEIIKMWQNLALKNGLKGIYFIAQRQLLGIKGEEKNVFELGFDAVNNIRLHKAVFNIPRPKAIVWRRYRELLGIPMIKKYKDCWPKFNENMDYEPNHYPSIIPNWDHTPRSGKAGFVLTDSTPEEFGKHADDVLHKTSKSDNPNKIIFLKSWNEWGEGNYMEPDLKYGNGYIEALKKAILRSTL